MQQQKELWIFLKALKRSSLTVQQKKTIKGQALAGDLLGAQKGFQRLTRAREDKTKKTQWR